MRSQSRKPLFHMHCSIIRQQAPTHQEDVEEKGGGMAQRATAGGMYSPACPEALAWC